jgi:hypothetical protein
MGSSHSSEHSPEHEYDGEYESDITFMEEEAPNINPRIGKQDGNVATKTRTVNV